MPICLYLVCTFHPPFEWNTITEFLFFFWLNSLCIMLQCANVTWKYNAIGQSKASKAVYFQTNFMEEVLVRPDCQMHSWNWYYQLQIMEESTLQTRPAHSWFALLAEFCFQVWLTFQITVFKKGLYRKGKNIPNASYNFHLFMGILGCLTKCLWPV